MGTEGFRDQVVIITGASSGIGEALLKQLHGQQVCDGRVLRTAFACTEENSDERDPHPLRPI